MDSLPSRISQQKLKTLRALFSALPSSLPEDPVPSYQLALDPEDIEDIGYPGALNKLLHAVWGYRANGIQINSRGPKLNATVDILEYTLSHTDDLVVHTWVDTLCDAARAAGALIQSSPNSIVFPTAKSTLQPSVLKPIKSLKGFTQAKLSFKVLDDKAKEEYGNRLRETMARRNEEAEATKEEQAISDERERHRKVAAAREARRIKQQRYRAKKRASKVVARDEDSDQESSGALLTQQGQDISGQDSGSDSDIESSSGSPGELVGSQSEVRIASVS